MKARSTILPAALVLAFILLWEWHASVMTPTASLPVRLIQATYAASVGFAFGFRVEPIRFRPFWIGLARFALWVLAAFTCLWLSDLVVSKIVGGEQSISGVPFVFAAIFGGYVHRTMPKTRRADS